MSRKYAKRRCRSRRKPAKELDGQVRGLDTEGATVQLSLPINEILAGVHGAARAVDGDDGVRLAVKDADRDLLLGELVVLDLEDVSGVRDDAVDAATLSSLPKG